MDNNNATEKCNTNLESSEPGLQDRLYLKLLGPTLESKKRLGICYYVFYPPTLYSNSSICIIYENAYSSFSSGLQEDLIIQAFKLLFTIQDKCLEIKF